MTNQRLQWAVLSLIFIAITIVVVMMWWPYLTLLAMGVILAILFHPIYSFILKRAHSETFSAGLTLILILLIVIIPLYIIGQLLFNELIVLYNQYRGGGLTWNNSQMLQNLPPAMRTLAQNFGSDLGQRFSGFASNAFASATQLVSNVAGFFLSFFLLFFSIYYLLRDGDRVKKYLAGIFPLSQSHEDLLILKLEKAINGVVKGMFLIALVQGGVATAGFLVFGVPQPLLWGAFTFLAALVPTVGTSLALIPAVVYLFVTGHTGAAVGMAIWAIAAVGTIDNIVGPRIVGSRVDMHPLLILFSVLGGLSLFGFFGVLLGPIIMTVFVTLVEIYKVDLKEHLER